MSESRKGPSFWIKSLLWVLVIGGGFLYLRSIDEKGGEVSQEGGGGQAQDKDSVGEKGGGGGETTSRMAIAPGQLPAGDTRPEPLSPSDRSPLPASAESAIAKPAGPSLSRPGPVGGQDLPGVASPAPASGVVQELRETGTEGQRSRASANATAHLPSPPRAVTETDAGHGQPAPEESLAPTGPPAAAPLVPAPPQVGEDSHPGYLPAPPTSHAPAESVPPPEPSPPVAPTSLQAASQGFEDRCTHNMAEYELWRRRYEERMRGYWESMARYRLYRTVPRGPYDVYPGDIYPGYAPGYSRQW